MRERRQLALPLTAVQRRLQMRETAAFYGAVIELRRRGQRVYRCGRHHSTVNGRIMPNRRLMTLVQAGLE